MLGANKKEYIKNFFCIHLMIYQEWSSDFSSSWNFCIWLSLLSWYLSMQLVQPGINLTLSYFTWIWFRCYLAFFVSWIITFNLISWGVICFYIVLFYYFGPVFYMARIWLFLKIFSFAWVSLICISLDIVGH